MLLCSYISPLCNAAVTLSEMGRVFRVFEVFHLGSLKSLLWPIEMAVLEASRKVSIRS